jgi:arylformamidase
MQPIDWDDAFANMAHVEGSAGLPRFWADRAADYRAQLSQGVLEADIPYGTGARNTLDIIWPDGPPTGLAVFVHGGYWMRLDKSHWTDFAEGARARGWAVAIPSYTLTPDARIRQITREIGQAITLCAARVTGPIRLAGHSAGGHLVSRMLCSDSTLSGDLRLRVKSTLSISGLHDLRPLMKTAMNDILHLDPVEAADESPALHTPFGHSPLTCWVGGGERPEFIRQARLMAMMWRGLDVPAVSHVDVQHNHFTVIEALRQADTPLTDAFLGIQPEGEN